MVFPIRHCISPCGMPSHLTMIRYIDESHANITMFPSIWIRFKDEDHDEEHYKIRSITKRLSISSDFLITIPASY